MGGKAAAVVSGAYVVSSNRVGMLGLFSCHQANGVTKGNSFGGQGWIVEPDGALLAKTDKANPILTVDIDISKVSCAHTLNYFLNIVFSVFL